MCKLILMQGLPASGKTRRAFEIYKKLEEEGKKVIRVHPDMVLNMLHFFHRDQPILKDLEALNTATDIVTSFLKKDYIVILDDYNLDQSRITGWKSIADEHKAEFQLEMMNVPVQQCVFYDAWREESVGYDVINAMAMEHGLLPAPKKEFVIVHLDGVVDGSYDLSTEGGKKDFRNAPANELYLSRMKDLARDEYKVVYYSENAYKDKGIIVDWLDKYGLWTGGIGFTPVTLFIGKPIKDVFETYFKTKYPIFRAICPTPNKEWEKYGVYVEKL